jgi:hypothetical protein
VNKAKKFDVEDEPFKAFLCRFSVGVITGGAGGHISHLLSDSKIPKRIPLLVLESLSAPLDHDFNLHDDKS